MEPIYKHRLPIPARSVVDEIEARCGREIEVSCDPSLSAGGRFFRPSVENGVLGPIKITFRDPVPDLGLFAHEVLHGKHNLVNEIIRTAWLIPVPEVIPPGAPQNMPIYGLDWWVNHIFVSRELTTFGLSEVTPRTIVTGALRELRYIPDGMWRRLVAFGAWLYIAFAFPDLRLWGAARLFENDLFEGAQRLEALVRPCFTSPGPSFASHLKVTTSLVSATGATLDSVAMARTCKGEDGWGIHFIDSKSGVFYGTTNGF